MGYGNFGINLRKFILVEICLRNFLSGLYIRYAFSLVWIFLISASNFIFYSYWRSLCGFHCRSDTLIGGLYSPTLFCPVLLRFALILSQFSDLFSMCFRTQDFFFAVHRSFIVFAYFSFCLLSMYA